MSAGKLASLLSATAALGCGTEAPIPEVPTWAQDVQPILRANCFHCHGATADYKVFRTMRWDVFDLGEEPYQRMGFEKVFEEELADGKPVKVATFFGASESSHGAIISAYIDVSADERIRMPPAPATPLSARDRVVVQMWADLLKKQPASALKGSHPSNTPPTISWVDVAKLVAVRDEDGDQVLGRLDCGGVEVRIQHSGGVPLPEGARPPCRGTLYDGYAEASVSLE
jgi:hypothetical protein